MPFRVLRAITLLKSVLERGRAALANMRPVASAVTSSATAASAVTTTLPYGVAGVSEP